MKRLEGKVAVLTGGNSGIGLASAKRLHEEGARVVITGRERRTLDAAVSAIGAGTVAIQSDVSKLEDIDRLFAVVDSKVGKIDVLFATNVKGVYFTLQKALPHLNDGASVILNTSVVSSKGTENAGNNAATKAAVRSYARTAASEFQNRNNRDNAVAPGPIATPIIGRTGMTEEQMQGYQTSITASVPKRRIGRAEEVASAVAFLASDDASYITGVELNVDGGMANL